VSQIVIFVDDFLNNGISVFSGNADHMLQQDIEPLRRVLTASFPN
jgi:hypothetical protein